MIQKLIKNELKQKRLRRFLNVRRAVISLGIVALMLGLSLTAEFWANSKPLVMIYDGHVFAPSLRTYHPSRFGQDGFVTDYRKLDWAKGRAIWPIIDWDPFESNKALATFCRGCSTAFATAWVSRWWSGWRPTSWARWPAPRWAFSADGSTSSVNA
jgi:microcin C transport system permease protein